MDETFKALDEQYARLQYQPFYRGAYLGRPLTRHVARPEELYGEVSLSSDMQQMLAALYPEQLADDLVKLRELSEERNILQALQDKIYQANGRRIVHRGREISRRDLPAAIREVIQEEEQVRQRIVAHDRQCRSTHLSAADKLGNGWKEYLLGLINVLHYAEHTWADLQDAQGLLANVLAIVTADGKVSKSELNRLISVANMLHAIMARIHGHKMEIKLDSALCERLKVAAWPPMLEEFTLPLAAKENINDWMRVIEGWVRSTASPLSALGSAALEQLLLTEDEVAKLALTQNALKKAPDASRLPAEYSTLIAGQERKRQKRLGLWSRFQTADGFMPSIARLLVAGAIVGSVLGLGHGAGVNSDVSIYNGLGQTTKIRIGQRDMVVAPFSSTEVEMELVDGIDIESRSMSGDLIESFKPEIGHHAQHYIYNIASSSPLVEWAAVYGSAGEQPPRLLGAPRWTTSSADVFFADPPRSVETKGGGATRWVLVGVGDRPPEEVLKLVHSEQEGKQIILMHTKWDQQNAPYTAQWRMLAGQ